MGQTVLQHLREIESVTEIVAYDVDPARVRQAEETYSVSGVTELDQVLEDAEIPLVFITAANFAHEELAVACLEAGKAVMCEKPMALTLEGARHMVETAERLGAWFQIGFELRYSKLYTKVKTWIEAGLLGEVVNTTCLYTSSSFGKDTSWRLKAGTGGSMMGEKLSHYVDLPRWWVGSEVTEVYATCAPNVIPYMEIHDNYHVTYRFASGAASHLTFLMGHPATFHGDPLRPAEDQQVGDGHELRYIVVGTQGAAEADVFHKAIKRWKMHDGPETLESELVEQLTWEPAENHFYFHNTHDQTVDIVRRVQEGLPSATPARDAYDTMRVCFAADLSADTGKVVKLEEVR
jgi:predicted dehydrogenase